MSEDKVNIGLSLEANKIADLLFETKCFEDKLSIAKFAIGYAIKNHLEEEVEEYKFSDAGGTKWNIGSVDNDQVLRNLIQSIYPEVVTPYRYIESLINVGLIKIGESIQREGLHQVSDFM